MATPASMISTLIKVQGMQPALSQLSKYDTAGRKASLGADKAAASSDRLGKSARGATPHLSGMVKAALGAVGAFAAFSAAKSAINDTVALSGSVAKLSAITGMDAKQASIWIETMKVRGVETKAVSMGFITLARNMRSATNGSAKAADAFKELGISQDVIKKGDMNDILLRSADAFAKMTNPAERAALAQQLFGRQAQALIPFLSQGRKGVEGALAAAERYGAFLPKNVDTLNKAREAQRGMNLAMDGVKIAFATAVMPALVSGVQALLGFITQIRNGTGAGGVFGVVISTAFNAVKAAVDFVVPIVGAFIQQIKNGTGIGGAFASAISTVVSIFSTLFNVAKAVVGVIVGFVDAIIKGKTWAVVLAGAIAGLAAGLLIYQGALLAVKAALAIAAGAQWLFNAALTANPIGIVIVAIAAFVGALVALYLKVGWFRDMVNDAWDAIKSAAQAVFPVIVTVVKGAWDYISKYTSTVFNTIKSIIEGVLKVIRGIINVFAGLFTLDFGRMWNGIKSIFSGAGQALLGILNSLTAPFRIVAGVIMGAFSGGISAAWNGIKSLVSSIGHQIVGIFNGFFNAMFTVGKYLFNGVWSGMKSVAQWVLDRIFDFINGVLTVINVPLGWVGVKPIVAPHPKLYAKGGIINSEQIATGGKITRPLAVIGEQAPRHPEFVVPTNPAYRGRAMGLFGALGNELGVPGFALGGILGGALGFAGKIGKTLLQSVVPAPLQAALNLGGKAAVQGLIGTLPGIPGLPDGLGQFPKFVLSKVSTWLLDVVAGGLDKAGGGPVIARMVSTMNAIAAKNYPYVYGGGHNSAFSGPYDCSGLVSAILHAGGFINSPMTTDGLKNWGLPGDGAKITVGVWGSTGANAHTMMKLGNRYLESGSGHGAAWVPGWSMNFPIHRRAPGYARGGVFGLMNQLFPPEKYGWGLAQGGMLPPYGGSFGGGGLVPGPAGAARTIIAHGGEPVGGPMVNIEQMIVQDSFDERALAHRLAFLLEM